MAKNIRKALTQQDFVLDVIDKCMKNNITFNLTMNKPEEGCSGYFNDQELMVYADREDWIEILVHESCHLDQFLEKAPCYFDEMVRKFNIWDSTLLRMCPQGAEDAFKAWTEMEIDCDIRSVEKIKKYNIDIDIPKYIQRANCYHQAYYYFHKHHIFYDIDNPPYLDDDVCETLTDKKMLTFKECWKENPVLERFLVHHNTPI